MKNIINKLKKEPYEIANLLDKDDLEKIILYAADQYYNTCKPIISDAIYDMLIDFLKYKYPKSKVLKNIGSSIKAKNKVKLDYHLGSMDKVKPPSKELNKWKLKYSSPYILTEKLDGISGLLIYRKDNKTINLYTRGTSTEGLDISSLLKYIKHIPNFVQINKIIKKYNIKSTNKKNLIALEVN